MKDSDKIPQHKRMAMGLPVNGGMSAAKAKKAAPPKPKK